MDVAIVHTYVTEWGQKSKYCFFFVVLCFLPTPRVPIIPANLDTVTFLFWYLHLFDKLNYVKCFLTDSNRMPRSSENRCPFSIHWQRQGLSPCSDTSRPSPLWLLLACRALAPRVSVETAGLNPGSRQAAVDFVGDRNPINKLDIQKRSLSSGNGVRWQWQRQMYFVCLLCAGFVLY